MAVELAAAYVQLIPSARGIQSSIANELTGPVGKAGKDAGGGFMGSLGGSLKAGLVGVGIAAAAVFAKGFADALAQDKALDQVAASLGLDPKTQAEVGSLAGKLYADAYGESFGEVASAVAQISKELGIVDQSELENVTKNALDFSAAMGTDVTESIDAARTLLVNGLVKDGEGAFDLLTRGMQELPVGVRDELLSATTEYSTFFADLGISGAQAFHAISEAAESGGQYGVDKVGDALKELTIRSTDMSKTSVDAYEAAGLSAEDMAAKFLAGGDDARGALSELIAGLQGIEDPVERANAAVGLFGTPLEDLSVTEIPDFLQSLYIMDETFGNTAGAATEMGNTLNDNAATKIESFKRTALQGLTNFIGDEVLPALEDFGEWFESTAGPALADVADLIIGDVVPSLHEFYVGLAEEITPAVQDLWQTFQEDLLPALEELWTVYRDDILPVQQEVYGFIFRNLIPVIGWLAEAIGNLVRFGIEQWNKMKWNIALLVQTATDVYNGVKEKFDSLVGFFQGLPGRIASAASGMWNGIRDGFLNVLNTIIDAWNGLSFTIPEIDIPGIGKVGGGTLNTPNIPNVPKPNTYGESLVGGSIPLFNLGGTFRSGGGVGFAALHDGERVLTTQQNHDFDRLVRLANRLEGDDMAPQIVVDGRVLGEVVRNHDSIHALRNA